MKKLILALLALFIMTGCVNLNEVDVPNIIENGINAKTNLANQYRTGYKYYLPRGLNIVNQSDYNEQLNTDCYTYYLYVDIVSYYNNVQEDYKVNKDAYYSEKLATDKKYGYVEINPVNDKYLVEIMYNYAKIEVIVKENDLKSTIANAITILNSLKYNDNIIENVMGDNNLQYKETEINIFETKKTESNTINYEEIYGQYNDNNETHDSDLID